MPICGISKTVCFADPKKTGHVCKYLLKRKKLKTANWKLEMDGNHKLKLFVFVILLTGLNRFVITYLSIMSSHPAQQNPSNLTNIYQSMQQMQPDLV